MYYLLGLAMRVPDIYVWIVGLYILCFMIMLYTLYHLYVVWVTFGFNYIYKALVFGIIYFITGIAYLIEYHKINSRSSIHLAFIILGFSFGCIMAFLSSDLADISGERFVLFNVVLYIILPPLAAFLTWSVFFGHYDSGAILSRDKNFRIKLLQLITKKALMERKSVINLNDVAKNTNNSRLIAFLALEFMRRKGYLRGVIDVVTPNQILVNNDLFVAFLNLEEQILRIRY